MHGYSYLMYYISFVRICICDQTMHMWSGSGHDSKCYHLMIISPSILVIPLTVTKLYIFRLQLSSSLQSGTEGNESYGSYLNLDVTNNPQLRNKAVEKLLKKTEVCLVNII